MLVFMGTYCDHGANVIIMVAVNAILMFAIPSVIYLDTVLTENFVTKLIYLVTTFFAMSLVGILFLYVS